MKPDQARVKDLLAETVILLCKNGLRFTSELKVQGLIGITLDNNDTFLVSINETVSLQEDLVLCNNGELNCSDNSVEIAAVNKDDTSSEVLPYSNETPGDTRPRRRGSKRVKTCGKNSRLNLSPVIKTEVESIDCEDSSRIIQLISDFADNVPASDHLAEANASSNFAPEPTNKSSFKAAVSQPILTRNGKDGELGFPGLEAQNLTPCLDGIYHLPHDDGNFMIDDSFGFDDQNTPDAKNHSTDIQFRGSWTSPPQGSGKTPDDPRKSFPCEYDGCNLSFYQSSTLYRHQRIKHGRRFGVVDQRSFYCSYPNCGRVFYRELALIKHQNHVHGV